jgi:hypothetical protein
MHRQPNEAASIVAHLSNDQPVKLGRKSQDALNNIWFEVMDATAKTGHVLMRNLIVDEKITKCGAISKRQ